MDRQRYRELTPIEMEIVAGGTTSEDPIEVWGNPYDVGSGGWNSEWEDYYDPPPEQGGSGGGGEEATCTCTAHSATEVDALSDAYASKLARDIKAQSDWQRREYVGVIYKAADGHLAVGQLQTGAGVYADIDFAALGISPSQVVGVVHNHPDALSDDYRGDYINRFPSEPGSGFNGTSDWEAADAMVQAGADASTLTLYVLGYDGMLREFDYADKERWVSADKLADRVGDTVSSSLQPPACPVHPAP